jgi:hypothetical protein
MKRGRKIQINFSNRWLYTFIALGILLIGATGVYAWASSNGVGHTITELQPCGANKILKMNSAGDAWTCGDDVAGSSQWTDFPGGAGISYVNPTGIVAIGSSTQPTSLRASAICVGSGRGGCNGQVVAGSYCLGNVYNCITSWPTGSGGGGGGGITSETDPVFTTWKNSPTLPSLSVTGTLTASGGYISGGLYGWCRTGYSASLGTFCAEVKSPASCSGSVGGAGSCRCPAGYTQVFLGASGAPAYYSCYKN